MKGVDFEFLNQIWALGIGSMVSLSLPKGKVSTLMINIDTNENKKIVEKAGLKLKNKKQREVVFYNDNDMMRFIYHCRRLYKAIKNTYLPVNL